MQELKTIHRVVARDLALGLRLKEICDSRGLNFSSWCNTVTGELFKAEVARMESEIENSIKEDLGTDAVMAKLKALGMQSVNTLESAMVQVVDQPASAVTAAKIILESLGYRKKEEVQKAVVINISQGKIESLPESTGNLESVKI